MLSERDGGDHRDSRAQRTCCKSLTRLACTTPQKLVGSRGTGPAGKQQPLDGEMCMMHSLCMPRRPSPGCLEGLLCAEPATSLGNKLSWGPYLQGRSQDAPAPGSHPGPEGGWKGRQRERHAEVRQGKPVGSQVGSTWRTSS